jgi:hypothetical protein
MTNRDGMIELAATPSALTPATLFRRYSADGSGRIGSQREERLFDTTFGRAGAWVLDAPIDEAESYFVATDTADFDREMLDVILRRD